MPDRMGREAQLMQSTCNYSQCECSEGSSNGRNFLTRQEKIEMLREYKEALDNESQGVAEKIKELEKAA